MHTISRAGLAAATLFAAPAAGDHDGLRADGHAPIGVMGDHIHDAGEFMVSYRFMRMEMEGSRIGTDEIGPEAIVATIANVNAPPPTLRVVPLSMTTDMHMFGAMWAPSDRVTLMGMVTYLDRTMDHVTFQGMTGTTRLGEFTTRSQGFGDTRLSALVGLVESDDISAHVQIGVSLPTGSIDETDDVLTPMNTRPVLTAPYPMQLGSGTFDPLLGVTVRGRQGDFGWGAQASAALRIHDNDADYRLGDEVAATAWGSFAVSPAVSLSARANARSRGNIEGRDVRIVAPVQTANPAFQGGDRIDLGFGVNFAGQAGTWRGHRIGLEVSAPVYQNLDGPQLQGEWTATVGWQYSFGG